LSARHPFPHLLALWAVERPSDADSLSARAHLDSCPSCRDWFDAQVPAAVMRRQTRLSRYCCASMFVASEETDRRKGVVVSFTIVRDEICWMIDGKQTYARFCPWCGQALPDRPFIEDDGAEPT